MNSVICPGTLCRPVTGDILKFRDDHHLTNTYAIHIAPQLETKLVATGAFG
jgi:hypothetical protein